MSNISQTSTAERTFVSVVESSMADSVVDLAIRNDREEEGSKIRGDFADCDEYSSGSDKSFEADDAENNIRGDSVSDCRRNQPESIKSKRTRRNGSHGSRRHKGGSRHKHKGFQPYPSRGDPEFQNKRKSLELQEKEDVTSVIRHDDEGTMFTTFPSAPFNSTQFLMEEHSANSSTDSHKLFSNSLVNPCSPDNIGIHSVPLTPVESSHEAISFDRKDKEFKDFFATAHAESLQSLTKEELVKHYMNLEEKIAALQKKVAQQQQQKLGDSCSEISGNIDKLCSCDPVCYSDTNSLSSSNEDLVDFSVVSQPSMYVAEASMIALGDAMDQGYSEKVKSNSSGCIS